MENLQVRTHQFPVIICRNTDPTENKRVRMKDTMEIVTLSLPDRMELLFEVTRRCALFDKFRNRIGF